MTERKITIFGTFCTHRKLSMCPYMWYAFFCVYARACSETIQDRLLIFRFYRDVRLFGCSIKYSHMRVYIRQINNLLPLGSTKRKEIRKKKHEKKCNLI